MLTVSWQTTPTCTLADKITQLGARLGVEVEDGTRCQLLASIVIRAVIASCLSELQAHPIWGECDEDEEKEDLNED